MTGPLAPAMSGPLAPASVSGPLGGAVTSGPLAPATPESVALLVLLLAGHVLADFLFQTRTRVEGKRTGRGRDFAAHGGVVLVVHLAVLLPLLSGPVAAVVVGVSVLHIGIDWLRCHGFPARWSELRAFAVDQAAHLLAILLGWAVLVAADGVPGARWLSEPGLELYLGGAVLAAAFAFTATGGAVLVEGVLGFVPGEGDSRNEGHSDAQGDRAGDHGDGVSRGDAEEGGADADAGYRGAGRIIGIIERTLVLLMALYGQWGAIALLIAAKSIARFEQIKVRRFAEYYLVGTLASLLVALVIGLLLTEILLPGMGGLFR